MFGPATMVFSLVPRWSIKESSMGCLIDAACICDGVGVRRKMATLMHGRWFVDGGI
jgi:hypothetical protein